LVKGARNLTEVDIGHRVCRWGVFLYQVKACAQGACGIGCTVVTGTDRRGSSDFSLTDFNHLSYG